MIEPSNEEQALWPDVTRDYIHDLEAEIERLREALREVRSCTGEHYGAARALKIIRAALGETE